MIFMNTKNTKTNGPHKFIFTLSQRLASKSSTKHVAIQNLKTLKYKTTLEKQ